MGRSPCCNKDSAFNRGAWTAQEDMILREYMTNHGEGKWSSVPIKAGLNRCGKSCRLRWMNYLRPDIKRGNISADEDELIIRLHGLLGNRWSLIAGRLPGRSDNEIKNYWNTKLSKKCLPHNQPLPTPNRKLNLAPPGDDHILKSALVKTKAVRLSKCCNKYGGSSISAHQDLNSPVVAKNTKNFKSSSELLTENESGFIDLKVQAQLGSPFMQIIDPFMPNLVDSPLLPSKLHRTEKESEASGSLLYFNQLQSADFDILSRPCYSPDNLRISEFEARPGNSLEQRMEEIYINSQQHDWLDELQYF